MEFYGTITPAGNGEIDLRAFGPLEGADGGMAGTVEYKAHGVPKR
jgi:hypothetical protein